MRRYFMTIPEAVQLVLQASAMGKRAEVFVLNMGEAVRITVTVDGPPGTNTRVVLDGYRVRYAPNALP